MKNGEIVSLYWDDGTLSWTLKGTPAHVEVNVKQNDVEAFQALANRDLAPARHLDEVYTQLAQLAENLEHELSEIKNLKESIVSSISDLEAAHKKRARAWLKERGGEYHD